MRKAIFAIAIFVFLVGSALVSYQVGFSLGTEEGKVQGYDKGYAEATEKYAAPEDVVKFADAFCAFDVDVLYPHASYAFGVSKEELEEQREQYLSSGDLCQEMIYNGRITYLNGYSEFTYTMIYDSGVEDLYTFAFDPMGRLVDIY